MNDNQIPVIDLDRDTVQRVINDLYTLSETSKDVRYRDFILEDGIKWTSWTTKEHIYKKKPEILPTMARGLFTKDEGEHEIVARGYDKFFNLFETNATQWDALDKYTTGPYEITAKENGCIILIASLSKDKIAVTSKHFIPENKTDVKAHAGVGYNWVIKHLASANKKEHNLAEWLFKNRVTLVAELCDDSFEEHVLPYTGKSCGLYLHGINHNTSTLHTLPSTMVQQVALEFGFQVTKFEVLNSIQAVRTFAEDMQRTGCYDGREIEGVVVRCKRDKVEFMFKIKNELYLQYREYREVTNSLLQVDSTGFISIHPTKEARCRYEKTKHYIEWLRKNVKENSEWFEEYKSAKGIVYTRQEFEKYMCNQQQ